MQSNCNTSYYLFSYFNVTDDPIFFDICHPQEYSLLNILVKLVQGYFKILSHVDPLLSNDREISSYTTAVAK
jgi:hypothetical protein